MMNMESVLSDICRSIRSSDSVCKRHLVCANLDYEHDEISLAFSNGSDGDIVVYVSERWESEYDGWYDVNIMLPSLVCPHASYSIDHLDNVIKYIITYVDRTYPDDVDELDAHSALLCVIDGIANRGNGVEVTVTGNGYFIATNGKVNVMVEVKLVDGYPYASVRRSDTRNLEYACSLENCNGRKAIIDRVNELLD